MLPPTAIRNHVNDHEARTRRLPAGRPGRTAARAAHQDGRRLARRPDRRGAPFAAARGTASSLQLPATPDGATAYHRDRAARRARAGSSGIGAAVVACRPDWAAGESRWTAIVTDGDAYRYVEVRSRDIEPGRCLLPGVIEQGIESFAAGLPAGHRLCHLINACPLHLAGDGMIFD